MKFHIADINMASSLIILVVLSIIGNISAGKGKKDECEVCIKFLNKFTESQNAPSDVPRDTETQFREFCAAATGKEERFCYAVGGLPHSATSILAKLTGWIDTGFPANKICQKIKVEGQLTDICALKYDKPIDISVPEKLNIKQLKKVLAELGVSTKGFVEKAEFVNAVKANAAQYVQQTQQKQEL